MGDDAVIIEGRDPYGVGESEGLDEQIASMFSTVHGAGRVMSRTVARGKTNRRTGKVLCPGAISREMMLGATGNVVLRGACEDEAPQAYK